MLKVVNRSILSGRLSMIELNCSLEQFIEADSKRENGELIQNAFPFLNPEEREFLISGINPKEWKQIFSQD